MAVPSSRRRSLRLFTRATAWVLCVLGAVVALLGAYLAIAPTDGTLTLFTLTWRVSELREIWAPVLLVGGGAVVTLSMGTAIVGERNDLSSVSLGIVEFMLAGCGAVAIGAGILLVL